MRQVRRFAFLSWLVITVFTLMSDRVVRAQSQPGIILENVGASYQFGEQITFVATIKSSIPVQAASIVIFHNSASNSEVEPLVMTPDGRTEFRWDTRQKNLRPFSTIQWTYQITLSDGSTLQTETFSVPYEDNRFAWQTLATDLLRVHWYQGDANFGQAALEAAQAGLESIHAVVPVDLTQPIEIFVYTNAGDLRGTLLPGDEDWVAGHADPVLGIVMVAIEPGAEQRILMEQRIPHELMHILLYRSIGEGYNKLPAWLREGLATLVELYPNADYDRVLTDASAHNDLIPLVDLCGSFPMDSGQAFLAYAESRSFTNYLQDTYGSAGLMSLAKTYAGGVECERGPLLALGSSLPDLEVKWQSSVLGQDRLLSLWQNTLPYLVLLCLVLIIPLGGIVSTLRRKGSRHEPETHVRK